MSRIKSINAQLKRVKELLPKIETEYELSLNKKEIEEDLKLDIQNYCGHLRSILDYLAKEIVDTHCPKVDPKKSLYFPITGDANSFNKMMTDKYPDLMTNSKDLYDFLESIQPYKSDKNIWLSQFNKVNNENKHNNLIEQKRTESRTVKVTSNKGGGSVSWGPGVRFSGGVSVMGVPIDPSTQMPVPNNTTTTQVTIWVDFKFDGINVSALGLLRQALSGIEDIVDKVIKKL